MAKQITLCWLIIFISIVIHELAHAYVMYKKGIPIKEIGFGLRVKYLPSLSFKLQTKNKHSSNDQIVIRFNLIPVIAYVEPSNVGEALIEHFPYKDSALISGAGPMSNLIAANILLILSLLFSPASTVFIVLFSILLLILWLFRKPIICYVFPLASLLVLVGIIYLLRLYPFQTFVGPVTITKFAAENSEFFSNLSQILYFFFAINLSIGLCNLLPIAFLDGGRIIGQILKSINARVSKSYEYLSLAMIIAIIEIVILSDLVSLLKK